MVDFHSHILPRIDDGSKSVEESLSMLRMLKTQGVDIVVATPHFSASRESVVDFINRREASYNEIKPFLTEDIPDVLLGAEVSFYDGVSRLENLELLCAGESRLLLIEMPVKKWSESSIREICNIACRGNITVVLAHIERYLNYQSKDAWRRLLDSGVLLQVNARFFNSIRTRRKAFLMLRQNILHFLGSDCHNLIYRPPQLHQTYSLIEKKMGTKFLSDFTEYHRVMLRVKNSDNQ